MPGSGLLDAALVDLAVASVRRREKEMHDLTRAWVTVNSYTENVEGVDRVGGMLREAFSLPSLACERVPGAPGRFGEHLFWKSAAPGAPIALVGHHDTVFPPGHFEGWRVEGDRAIGPGALDMKGGLAVVWAALATLEELGVLARLPLVIASVADEEVGSVDSKQHLLRAAKGARAALVFESGRKDDAIVTRRRGVGAMTVVATGRAAHAGNAHADGANAIWALAKFIDAAQKLTVYERGRTVNVGLVKGGTSKNTVPERAECSLDMRFETVADAEALVADLRAAAAEAASVPGVTLTTTGGANRLPLEKTPASQALFEAWATCQLAAGLPAKENPLVGGGSDANTLGAAGIPCIDGLGPRGTGFHTTNEYVDLGTFVPKAEALVRFLLTQLEE